MARSGPPYPARFLSAASYAGFGPTSSPSRSPPRFSAESALILYALYQQASIGPCTTAKPSVRTALDNEKWKSWQALGNMSSIEAMRLFVKILEEEDPAWLSKVQDADPQESPKLDVKESLDVGSSLLSQGEPQPRQDDSLERETFKETQLKDSFVEEIAAITDNNTWICPNVSGRRPTPRYQHAAEIVGDKMYIIGGNHNGRYLNDIQVFDLKTFTWSKVDLNSDGMDSSHVLQPLAGHSLVRWGNKLLAVGGHSKEPFDTVIVRAFDLETSSWSLLTSNGKAPLARGGQSVTLVGSNLIMFGGEDAKRRLLNDLNILNLETMTWENVEVVGVPPAPRSDHTATVQAGRYFLVFGGGSHSTCFNDLHVLDLDSMEWSQPQPQGVLPTPRAGHSGVTIGDSWFIVGGGDNKSGISETLVLDMSTFVWSVVTSVEARAPIASEGLSVVSVSGNSEEVIIAFGGYNGRYNNDVYIMKTNQKAKSQPKYLESPAAAAAAAAVKAAYAVPEMSNGIPSQNSLSENRVKEIVMDIPDSKNVTQASKATGDLEISLSSLQTENARLKLELDALQSSNLELGTELRSVRGQLDDEQSRCFRLEVDLAELRQKLHSMDTLQKEVETLRNQMAAVDQEAATAMERKGSGGVWGWLAPLPPVKPSNT